MSAISDYVRHLFVSGHQIFQGVVGDVPEDMLHRKLEGSTIGTPASIIAHVVLSEDFIANSLAGKPMLYESEGWKDRIGVAFPGPMQTAEWAEAVRLTPVFFDYARAVFANTENIAGGMSEAGLQRKFQGMQGETTVGRWLSVGVIHVSEHSGELAALKGISGLKGLPF